MRAATFRDYGGPEVMLWEELDDPIPGADEVVIEVRACGLNHSDLDSRAGTSRWPFTMPWVLGAEFAGRVAAVGADVEGIAPGASPMSMVSRSWASRSPLCGGSRPPVAHRCVRSGPR